MLKPSEKALRDLRRRLGPAPFKALFEVVAGPLAQPHTSGVRFAGLRAVAFDGLNSFKIPGTRRNRAWAGKIRHRLGLAGYPALRVMILAGTGTSGLLGATVGSITDRDETGLARRLLRLLHRRRAGHQWTFSQLLTDVAPQEMGRYDRPTLNATAEQRGS